MKQIKILKDKIIQRQNKNHSKLTFKFQRFKSNINSLNRDMPRIIPIRLRHSTSSSMMLKMAKVLDYRKSKTNRKVRMNNKLINHICIEGRYQRAIKRDRQYPKISAISLFLKIVKQKVEEMSRGWIIILIRHLKKARRLGRTALRMS